MSHASGLRNVETRCCLDVENPKTTQLRLLKSCFCVFLVVRLFHFSSHIEQIMLLVCVMWLMPLSITISTSLIDTDRESRSVTSALQRHWEDVGRFEDCPSHPGQHQELSALTDPRGVWHQLTASTLTKSQYLCCPNGSLCSFSYVHGLWSCKCSHSGDDYSM
eukprot:6465312-Amphidinium_carterae.1